MLLLLLQLEACYIAAIISEQVQDVAHLQLQRWQEPKAHHRAAHLTQSDVYSRTCCCHDLL